MKMVLLLVISLFMIVSISGFDHSETYHKILDSYNDGSPKELFKIWHYITKKEYDINSVYALDRYKNFKAKLKEIKSHNDQNHSYKLGLNQFSDMTFEEFQKTYLTEENPDLMSKAREMKFDDLVDDFEKTNETSFKELKDYASIDYSKLTDARNQGQCGSCWAFSATTAIDVNRIIKFGVNSMTSPQQLVDCDTRNGGCNGGYYPYTYNYIQKNGLMLDKNYPYTSRQTSCQFKSNQDNVTISGVKFCNNDLRVPCSIDIVYNLLKEGALSVSVVVNQSFMSYRSGIYRGICSGTSNHGMLLVGYGFDTITKLNYWHLRNFWGTTWGDKGNIKIEVNDANNKSCFVTNRAYLPIVTK